MKILINRSVVAKGQIKMCNCIILVKGWGFTSTDYLAPIILFADFCLFTGNGETPGGISQIPDLGSEEGGESTGQFRRDNFSVLGPGS